MEEAVWFVKSTASAVIASVLQKKLTTRIKMGRYFIREPAVFFS